MKIIKIILRELFDMLSFLVFVAGIVLFVRFFIFNPFTVVGSSMMSTIKENDILIVDKVSAHFRAYERGDILVFVPPGKQDAFIKRVIGMPGETVIMANNKTLICEGGETDRQSKKCRTLDENYLDEGITNLAQCGKTVFDVETGSYFVMGDNRPGSTDGRCCFGSVCNDETPYTINNEHIIGRASLRLLPFNAIGGF